MELVLDRETEPVVRAPLQPLRLHWFFEKRCDATPTATALICAGESLSYAALDARANRLAHYLRANGVGPGDRVGIRLERSVFAYVALLGILKSGAAFVPVDQSYPADRLEFIVADAGLSLVLETEPEELASMPDWRTQLETGGDTLAYIIYTSGTTGRPKGVAVNHTNICFFLNACAPVYGIDAADRVYQGMTFAFDFSIEEIWPTWIAGATLIAAPCGPGRIGSTLTGFLRQHGITVLYAVPTLLATLEGALPNLRLLVVGGESCPQDLVERWSPRVERMLNTYGPTETTVTATWTELAPGKPVTIGRPMPGYDIRILDGEICIGGPGVAQGYVNRPDLTAEKFIPDPIDCRARLYRSGDLGRFTPNGEIEFLGRMDGQVKLRGFRMEVGEIEAVLLEDPAVQNAAVIVAGSPVSDLAAYITLQPLAPSIADLRERLAEQLRRRLPAYMLPAYLEILETMPVLASGKIDRAHMPAPASPRWTARTADYVEPASALEHTIAAVWRSIFCLDQVSVAADFFLDLGGHSLYAARAVSQLRREPGLTHASIADLYAHPTIRSLAVHLENRAPRSAHASDPPLTHSNARVWLAGLAQLALLYLVFAIFAMPGAWLLAEHDHAPLGFTAWDVTIPCLVLLISLLLPITLKRILIGRFRPGTYPLWSWFYCRLWLVRKAIEFSPVHHMAGSPFISIYARLLGARIGRDCHIGTSHLSLPDLIEIGEGASIGYDVELQPFVVEGGRLHLAPIRIGSGAFIGAKCVILGGSVIGDGARVAEQSLVGQNQSIPAGESWCGSPCRPCPPDPIIAGMDARPGPSQRLSIPVRTGYLAGVAALEVVRLIIALPGLLLISALYHGHGWAGAAGAIPVAGLLFALTTCAVVLAGKCLVLHRTRAGIYPANSWFGLRKWFVDQLMLTSLGLTNTLYATLYAAPWLRALGARIGPRSEVSTVSHIDPDLLTLGSETFIADLASLGAAVFHKGHIALSDVQVGDRTFVGNAAVVRGGATLPGGCLIGVASVAPTADPQSGSSWLGSPSLFLPKRQVYENFDNSVTYRPPARWFAYRLLIEFLRIVVPPTLLYAMGTAVALLCRTLLARYGFAAAAFSMPAIYLIAALSVTVVVAAMKWLIIGRYRPRVEPLWAPFVRHSELITGLYESVAVPALIGLLTGTPALAPLLRLFGVHIGARVWLDTTYITEFDLVHIGEDAAIGRAASLQTHLFEDRIMKMSTVTIGAGAAVGSRSVVLYDSHVCASARLDSLSLAMKGESLPSGTRWTGIPAQLAS